MKTLSASPVTGELIQDNGGNYDSTGSATSTMVKYTAPSGALVLTTGTNHWNRGLAINADGVGEPDPRIQQTTTNILEDMGAMPATPAADITLDTARSRPAAPTGVDRRVRLGTDSVQVDVEPRRGRHRLQRLPRRSAPRDGGQPLGVTCERRARHRHDLHRHRAQLGDHLLLRRHLRRRAASQSLASNEVRRDDCRVRRPADADQRRAVPGHDALRRGASVPTRSSPAVSTFSATTGDRRHE